METDASLIYLDRLSQGREQLIEAQLSPEFMDIEDKELFFDVPISVDGRAYLAEDELIMQIDVETVARVHCAICNELTDFKLSLDKVYLTKEIRAIQGVIFDFRDLVREEILLNIPHLVECQGNCPKRQELGVYIKEEASEEGTFRPFEGL